MYWPQGGIPVFSKIIAYGGFGAESVVFNQPAIKDFA
jgi:hypothetical protein